MVKSGLEKIFLKFLHAGEYFPLLHKSTQNYKFSNKNNFPHGWISKYVDFSRPLFTIIFRQKMLISDTYTWRDFNKTFCDVCTYHKWNFKPFHSYSFLSM